MMKIIKCRYGSYSKSFSIGVPSLYSMLADIHDKNGKLAWKTLFEDAIF